MNQFKYLLNFNPTQGPQNYQARRKERMMIKMNRFHRSIITGVFKQLEFGLTRPASRFLSSRNILPTTSTTVRCSLPKLSIIGYIAQTRKFGATAGKAEVIEI